MEAGTKAGWNSRTARPECMSVEREPGILTALQRSLVSLADPLERVNVDQRRFRVVQASGAALLCGLRHPPVAIRHFHSPYSLMGASP